MKESLFAKGFRVFNEYSALIILAATIVSALVVAIGFYYGLDGETK